MATTPRDLGATDQSRTDDLTLFRGALLPTELQWRNYSLVIHTKIWLLATDSNCDSSAYEADDVPFVQPALAGVERIELSAAGFGDRHQHRVGLTPKVATPLPLTQLIGGYADYTPLLSIVSSLLSCFIGSFLGNFEKNRHFEKNGGLQKNRVHLRKERAPLLIVKPP